MHTPQFIYLTLVVLGVGGDLAKDGELKTGIAARHNFWLSLFNAAIACGLLWWGGFFSR